MKREATPKEVARVLSVVLGLLVDDAFVVDPVPEGDTATILRVTLAPDDLGKVIGKQGRMARSLRTVLCAASMKAGHRYSLEIVEAN